jgi:hypothetical protein
MLPVVNIEVTVPINEKGQVFVLTDWVLSITVLTANLPQVGNLVLRSAKN